MRCPIVSAIVVLAGQSVAQDPYWDEYQFEVRDMNDLFGRGFEDSYVLESRDFDNNYGLTARDYDDGYDLAVRGFDDGYYTHAARSYDMDSPVFARDISFITAADFHPRDLFHHNMGSHSWFRPSMSPLSKMLNSLSSPAHRDHSHLMFQGGHAFVVPPQHDSFDSLWDSFSPPQKMHQSHNAIMAHASVSNTGNGYSCTSSTVIGMDGIPHTTKHCSNTTPDSHMSITVGPSSSSSSSFDSDSDFFSDPFADFFSESNPSWHENVFAGQHTAPKFLRNKRILDLDSAPHRGEIHSYSENDAEHMDHADEHEESSHDDEHDNGHEHESKTEHDSLHSKHDLRGVDSHEHEHEHEDEHEHDHDLVRILSGKKEKRKAEAEARVSSENSAELGVRDAEPEAAPVGQT